MRFEVPEYKDEILFPEHNVEASDVVDEQEKVDEVVRKIIILNFLER